MASDSDGKVRRYDSHAFKAEVGGQELEVAPIAGVAQQQAFQDALTQELFRLRDLYEQRARNAEQTSPETLLTEGVDIPRLLKLGLPGVITDELLERTNVHERQGLLVDVLYLNNLGRFAPFVSPELILELSMRLSRTAPGFPSPEPSTSSPEPVSAGERSKTS